MVTMNPKWLLKFKQIPIKNSVPQFNYAHFTCTGGCCCYCWVASVVSDSVWPQRWQPTRLPFPWDSPGKNSGVGCHFLLQCMKVKCESEVAQSCLTPSDPMDCSPQASPSMGFSRQEYWSGVPLPSPEWLRIESQNCLSRCICVCVCVSKNTGLEKYTPGHWQLWLLGW